MDTQKLIFANYLDMLFDGRNKQYGGYELRKNYRFRARKATTIIALAVIASLTIPVISAHLAPSFTAREINKPVEMSTLLFPVPKPVIPEIIPMKTIAATKTIADVVPQIVKDNLDDKPLHEVDELKNANVGLHTVTSSREDFNPNLNPDGKDAGKEAIDPPKKTKEIFTVVEQMPLFPGDVQQFLHEHTQYPESAQSTGAEGRINLEFVVNEDGSISNVTVLNKADASLCKEAIRVISSMPHWKPGKQGGQPVKVYFKLQISFSLSN